MKNKIDTSSDITFNLNKDLYQEYEKKYRALKFINNIHYKQFNTYIIYDKPLTNNEQSNIRLGEMSASELIKYIKEGNTYCKDFERYVEFVDGNTNVYIDLKEEYNINLFSISSPIFIINIFDKKTSTHSMKKVEVKPVAKFMLERYFYMSYFNDEYRNLEFFNKTLHLNKKQLQDIIIEKNIKGFYYLEMNLHFYENTYFISCSIIGYKE